MRGVFGRLGMVGAILVASALIFAGIAGGVVVHRLESTPAGSSTQQQGNQQRGDQQRGNHADETGDGQSNDKPAGQAPASAPEPDDSQDKGA